MTATFKANDAVLNTNVENVADFGTITKTFKVVVKGTGEAKPSEEDLLAILNKYYTAESLTDFTTKEVIDSSNVTGDIQLLRYTRVKDENNNTVFNNKEITVTSDNENIIKINGYRASVDIFASQNKTEKVNLVITFTRDGVTVSKKIPLTVNMITDEELDTEITLMENVKKHYFDGINDGRYTDKDSITGNLHAFCEAVLDEKGNVIWIYDAALQKGTGIIPDDQFTDTWEMEAAGYNKFKSSNNAVVQHENLVVVQPENSTQITISSVLSSEKYGQFAQSHPDNEKLQKLYKQPVSVTVTVEGTKDTEVEPEDPTDKAEATLKVIVNTESGSPAEAFTVKAASDTAKSFGFEKPSEFANKVTILDIVVALHCDVYGDDFKNAPSDYLQIGKSNDQIFKIFGEENSNLSYLLNNEYPADASGNMTTLSKTAVSDGDVLNIFFYGDTKYYSDVYLYFTKADVSVKADDEFSLTLMKMGFDMTTFENVIAPQNGCKVSLTDGEGEVVAIGTTDENGVVKFIVSKAGSYSADVIKAPYDYFVSAHADVKVEAGIITPDTDKAPKTGDDGKIFAWIALMMVSGGFALVITAKKKNCIK